MVYTIGMKCKHTNDGMLCISVLVCTGIGICNVYVYTLYNYHTAQSACANDQTVLLNLKFM